MNKMTVNKREGWKLVLLADLGVSGAMKMESHVLHNITHVT